MIPRYSTPEMSDIWSDASKLRRWLEIELLATEAHAELGIVPAADATACRQGAPIVDDEFLTAVLEREAITDHDVAAFVDVVQAAIGDAGKWIENDRGRIFVHAVATTKDGYGVLCMASSPSDKPDRELLDACKTLTSN